MNPIEGAAFDTGCRHCERLSEFLSEVRQAYPDYYGLPVPSFGVVSPSLLIVGLAPGLHGANATGRPFTGDFAGVLLYETLYQLGFASAAESRSADDGLRLIDCRITNAVRCVPPQNKPTGPEVRNCLPYLKAELAELRPGGVVFALGTIAHRAVVTTLGLRQRDFPFGHGREHELPGLGTLLDSYHCSRYNTQTGRLTADMFHSVVARARALLDKSG